jgi:hypothetical protein
MFYEAGRCCHSIDDALTNKSQVPRSAVLLGEKKTQAVAERVGVTAGSSTDPPFEFFQHLAVPLQCKLLHFSDTCVDRRAPSTTATTCLWLKASHSTFNVFCKRVHLSFFVSIVRCICAREPLVRRCTRVNESLSVFDFRGGCPRLLISATLRI